MTCQEGASSYEFLSQLVFGTNENVAIAPAASVVEIRRHSFNGIFDKSDLNSCSNPLGGRGRANSLTS